ALPSREPPSRLLFQPDLQPAAVGTRPDHGLCAAESLSRTGRGNRRFDARVRGSRERGHARNILLAARGALCARWPAGKQHDPAIAGALHGYARLHGTHLWIVLSAWLFLYAAAARSGRSAPL